MNTQVNQVSITVLAASSVQVLGPNQYRRAMIISCPPTNRFTLSLSAAAVLDAGVTFFPADPPLVLSHGDIGDALGLPWFGISAVADQSVNIVEILESP